MRNILQSYKYIYIFLSHIYIYIYKQTVYLKHHKSFKLQWKEGRIKTKLFVIILRNFPSTPPLGKNLLKKPEFKLDKVSKAYLA